MRLFANSVPRFEQPHLQGLAGHAENLFGLFLFRSDYERGLLLEDWGLPISVALSAAASLIGSDRHP